MKEDASFGVVPLRFNDGHWEVFLICHLAGHWAFPKGHPNAGETYLQTAERELHEETALEIVELLDHSTILQENYHFIEQGEVIAKTVTYFMAKVQGEVSLKADEVQDGQWFSLDICHDKVTFPEAKKLCLQVQEILLFANQ